ncbi:hypothetical protein [Streptosporangium sp. G12]
MTTPEKFRNELLSLTTANPGWNVHIREVEYDSTTRKHTTSREMTYPIIAWAVVKTRWSDDSPTNDTEPVFVTELGPTHSSEYRRTYSDLSAPIQTTIGITVVQPS